MRLRAWLAAVLLGAAIALPAGSATRAKKKLKPEIAAKQADLAELRGRIEALRKDLSASEGHRAQATDQLRESEREISTLQRELHELGEERQGLQQELRELGRQAQELEATRALQQGRLEKLLYRQYVAGTPDTLQLLLNGSNPNQTARDLHYLGAIARARTDLLAEMRDTLARKRALADEARERAAELAEVEAEQKQRHASLVTQRGQRQQLLTRIADRISAQRKEIGNLQQDEKRLSQLIDRLGKLLAAQAARPTPRPTAAPAPQRNTEPPPKPVVEAENRLVPEASTGAFARLRGNLRLPVKGAVTGRFGAARDGSGTWKGVFIRSAGGNPVHAVADGRIVFAEWMRGFGNLLIIDHGDAYLSIYGNNESLLKQVGDRVRGGDVVANVGNSGGNPETGLYFELRHQGQPMDPLKWASLK